MKKRMPHKAKIKWESRESNYLRASLRKQIHDNHILKELKKETEKTWKAKPKRVANSMAMSEVGFAGFPFFGSFHQDGRDEAQD